MKKETSEEFIDVLLERNQRLLLILGVCSSVIMNCEAYIDKEKYDWILKSIDDVVYKDKPLPEFTW